MPVLKLFPRVPSSRSALQTMTSLRAHAHRLRLKLHAIRHRPAFAVLAATVRFLVHTPDCTDEVCTALYTLRACQDAWFCCC